MHLQPFLIQFLGFRGMHIFGISSMAQFLCCPQGRSWIFSERGYLFKGIDSIYGLWVAFVHRISILLTHYPVFIFHFHL